MDEKNQFVQVSETLANLGDSLSALNIIGKELGVSRIADVYHYTDVTGFISIMTKQELWASHIAFMNDRSEYLHGKELFRKKLIEKMDSVQEVEQKILQNALDSLDKEMSDSIMPTSGKDVFSVSFTYNRDSLEMWRGYGKESGIAIGFDWVKCNSLPGMCLIREEQYEALLEKYDNKPEEVCAEKNRHFFPQAVFYKDEKKNELAEKVINKALDYFRNINNDSEKPELAINTVSQFLSDLIFKINPFFKHIGFEGEKECRFVDNYTTFEKGQDQVLFRKRGGIILPYVKYKMMDLDCRPLKQIPIKEIVVGPGLKQQRAVDSVKYFLEKNNMNYLVDKVCASTIPYVDV